MIDFKIPTPEEVDYYEDSLLEKYTREVKERILKKDFKFPKYDNISDFIPKINKIISEFGWKIVEMTYGVKEDYHEYYEIKPLKNRS